MAYQAFALIHANTTLDLAQLAERLTHRLRHMRVLRVANNIEVYYRGWTVSLSFVAEPYVLVESDEIARRFGEDRPDRDIIANCNTRLEIRSDPDLKGERLTDYVGVLDVISRYENIVMFDPVETRFL